MFDVPLVLQPGRRRRWRSVCLRSIRGHSVGSTTYRLSLVLFDRLSFFQPSEGIPRARFLLLIGTLNVSICHHLLRISPPYYLRPLEILLIARYSDSSMQIEPSGNLIGKPSKFSSLSPDLHFVLQLLLYIESN